MKPYKTLLVILLLGLLAGTVPAAQAQSAAPTMTVTPAFDGYFKYGEWMQLYVDLQNPGGDVEAELSVRINSNNLATVYALPVSLPAGAHKLVTLNVLPNNYTRLLEVRLVSGDTLLVKQQARIRPNPNLNYLAGIISPERGALGLLNGIRIPGIERPKVLVDVLLEDLPEQVEPLGTFDLLVLNNTDTAKLTPGQANALQGWVEQGGRLVIGGGAGAAQTLTGLPDTLQPGSLDGMAEVQAGALAPLAAFAGGVDVRAEGSFPLAHLANPVGRVLAGSPEQPLIIEKSLGQGSLNFVALDLSAVPFEGWSGTQAFWEKLVANGASFPENMPQDMSERQLRSGSFYGALTNIPSLDLPSVRGLSLLLIIYILLVGPANYFLLRRLRRLHLAWVTIPAITAVFAGGAFGIGYAMRGNDLILNRIALVELQGSSPARVTTYMGLFSPRRQAYEIEVKSAGLVSPAVPDYGPEIPGMTPTSEMVFVQGDPAVVKGLSVDQFSMQSFMTEDTWEGLGDITGKLSIENDVLSGTIKNETSAALKDVVVAVNRRFQKLGELAPGQEVKVSLGLGEMNRDWMGPTLSYKIYYEADQQNWNNGRIPRDVMMKTNILDNVIDGPAWSKISSSMSSPGQSSGLAGILVFGWTDQAPSTARVRGHESSTMTTTLVYTNLPMSLEAQDRVALAPGLVRGRVVEYPRGMGPCGPAAMASVFLDNAEVEMEFQVPPELTGFQVNTLKLALSHDNPTAAVQNLSVYDWNQQRWGRVEHAGAGLVIIPQASAFVSPSGQVRVRVSNAAGNPSCYYVDMGLEAERQAGQGD